MLQSESADLSTRAIPERIRISGGTNTISGWRADKRTCSSGCIILLPTRVADLLLTGGSSESRMLADHPRGSTQRGLSDGPDGDEVAVLHRPHVIDVEGDKRLSFAGGGRELNLQTIGLVHLHDGSQVSTAKTVLR